LRKWTRNVKSFRVPSFCGLLENGQYGRAAARLSDLRASLFPRNPTGEVVIVAIDAKSIQAFGVWPWPRSIHGQLLRALQSAGAADVAFDVDFGARSDSTQDKLLSEALADFAHFPMEVRCPASVTRVGINDNKTLC
jgi:hypothetical protein